MSEEKILTLHPQSKKGANILKRKYDAIKVFIIQTIKEKKELSFDELSDLAVEKLTHTFDGKVLWYVVTVKLDLRHGKLLNAYLKAALIDYECAAQLPRSLKNHD